MNSNKFMVRLDLRDLSNHDDLMICEIWSSSFELKSPPNEAESLIE